jgi:hypothetical protein
MMEERALGGFGNRRHFIPSAAIDLKTAQILKEAGPRNG